MYPNVPTATEMPLRKGGAREGEQAGRNLLLLMEAAGPVTAPLRAILLITSSRLQNIVHRSVKCSHILVSGSGAPCKLTGLRYSCSLVESGSAIQDRYDYPIHVAKENLFWLSPEFLQQVNARPMISEHSRQNCFCTM